MTEYRSDLASLNKVTQDEIFFTVRPTLVLERKVNLIAIEPHSYQSVNCQRAGKAREHFMEKAIKRHCNCSRWQLSLIVLKCFNGACTENVT